MSKTFKRVTTILVTLAMSVGLCIGLAACSGGAASEEDQIRAELDKALGTLKNPTEESLAALLGDNMSSLETIKTQYGIDPVEMLQHLFAKFDYTIGDIKVDGDTADAQVTMENIDVQTVLNDAMKDLQNDSDFVAKITEAATSGNQSEMYNLIFSKMYEAIDAADETVTNTVDFKLTKTNGQWDISEEDLSNVVSSMYGGLDLSAL